LLQLSSLYRHNQPCPLQAVGGGRELR
jgi:hypothetical protein